MSDDTKPGQVAPTSSGRNGRNPDGTFATGNAGGPGRRRRPDLFAIASEYADEHGIDLRRALALAAHKLLEMAAEGDVQAAKLVFDRLCDADPIALELFQATGPTPPAVGSMAAYLARMTQAAKDLAGGSG